MRAKGGGKGHSGIGLLLCDAGAECIFHSCGAFAAPAVIGCVFRDGLFEDADWGERLDDFAAELLIGAFLAGEAGVSASAQAVN
jgi:hypothetical protein